MEHGLSTLKNACLAVKKNESGTSLAVQCLDAALPMRGARVRSLVGELDPTCCN